MIKRSVRVMLLMLLVLALLSGVPSTTSAAQPRDPLSEMLKRMSAAEKVGQLFLVTFPGDDLSPESDIAKLITEYHIGGVVISPQNGNFSNQGDTLDQVIRLTNGLQRLAHDASLEEQGTGTYIPLFIAVQHEGDGYPYTAIRNGTTPIPNQMAIGATWPEGAPEAVRQPGYAEKVGQIVGKELAALGVNMLLGPSLDVLNNPRPGLKGDLGTRTFGGDPYWVGKLGRAYIRGVHQGSHGRVATIAKHFPGNGGSDRSPEEEAATVDKSLQELRRIELAPFFAVTQGTDQFAITDGLMSSHIRYRGFQGNIRQLTRPISFDAQGLQALMALNEFASWRAQGVIVSDSLGVPAVRKYYDPQLTTFPHKRIAQDAFIAGNDLLLLSRFALTDEWPDHMANVRATLEFFREKYETDPTFQARVDNALRRILALKQRLYPQFALEEVQVDPARVADEVGGGTAEVAELARQAITLIYPGPGELADRLPSPPLSDEDILIFTDTRQVQDCPACEPFPVLPVDSLEKTILRLYGPKGAEQIAQDRVHSLSFEQLKAFLQPSEQTPLSEEERARIEQSLLAAEWIVFAMLDLNPRDYPASDAVKVFLKERSDSLRDKKIIVLAYNAPYYLDTTEISKLTAYYGVYSKMPPFVEASVRALFQEFMPSGASPVTIAGVNYDLVTQMEPRPDQAIEIKMFFPPGSATVNVGTTIRVYTRPILDRNGHLVPDGTPVTFRAFYPVDGLYLSPQETTTVNGIANAAILAERPGQLEITATSGQATNSLPLVLTVVGDQPVTATPPPTPTETPTPVPPTPTPEPTPEATPVPPASLPPRHAPGWADLILSLGIMLVAGGAGQALLNDGWSPPRRVVRLLLLSLACGLAGYVLLSVGWLHLAGLPLVGRAFQGDASARLEALSISGLAALVPVVVARWQSWR